LDVRIIFFAGKGGVGKTSVAAATGIRAAEMGHRTILIVTHRVSTVRDANRIIVLHNGEVQTEGTHSQLLKKNELYRRLTEMQLVKV